MIIELERCNEMGTTYRVEPQGRRDTYAIRWRPEGICTMAAVHMGWKRWDENRAQGHIQLASDWNESSMHIALQSNQKKH